MHLLVTGGSGFVGTHLVDRLVDAGHQVTLLSRTEKKYSHLNIRSITWDQLETAAVRKALESVETVVHLAGYSIANRWTRQNKHTMRTSRIDTIHQVMKAVSERCHSVISASATGRFPSSDKVYTESSPPPDQPDNFMQKLCADREGAVYRAAGTKRRVVIARFGNVLGEEGLLASLKTFKYLHTTVGFGSGDNWFSRIHVADLTVLLHRLIEDQQTAGVYHAVTREPVTWNVFLQKMRVYWHIRFHLQLPAWCAKLALGEQSILLLGAWKVTSTRLPELGFSCVYDTIDNALEHLSDSQ